MSTAFIRRDGKVDELRRGFRFGWRGLQGRLVICRQPINRLLRELFHLVLIGRYVSLASSKLFEIFFEGIRMCFKLKKQV